MQLHLAHWWVGFTMTTVFVEGHARHSVHGGGSWPLHHWIEGLVAQPGPFVQRHGPMM